MDPVCRLEPPGLGYRGFVVEGKPLGKPVRAYRDTVTSTEEGAPAFPAQGLERLLIETAPPDTIEESLKGYLRLEITG